MANTFGSGTGDIALSGSFVLISSTASTSKDNAVVRGATGEYIPDSEANFNEKTEIQLEYEANDPDAVGGGTVASTAAIHVTNVTVSTINTGFAKVSITGHKHGSTAHAAAGKTITLPAFNGFGATDFMETGATGIQSSTWSATVDHYDRQGPEGEFLCGTSVGTKYESSMEAVSDTAATPTGDWIYDTLENKKSNLDFYSVSAKAHQYIAG